MNTTTLETAIPEASEKLKKYYDRYNKQLKQERTLKIVKGLLTAIALAVTVVCF